MTRIDLERLKALQFDLYTSHVQSAFGDAGVKALQQLVTDIVSIYRRVDPALRSEPLVLFAEVDAHFDIAGTPRRVHSIANLGNELDGGCMARVNADNSMDVYALDPTVLATLSRHAIVYHHHQSSEKFVINQGECRLLNPMVAFGSVFCKPTFGDLTTALDTYRTKSAAHSSCEILKGAWYQPSRWFFKAKPEHIMRKSLVQYLSNVLEDAEVRPEQNVDESHPVDIKVSFSLTDLRAIIEIKWLGNSVDDNGSMTTGYTQVRAVSGAQQLAEYLDSSQQWAPGMKTRGYLVVFDARRKGLANGITTIAREDALHYKDAEITYSPDHSTIRDDFATPVRMYMFPKTA